MCSRYHVRHVDTERARIRTVLHDLESSYAQLSAGTGADDGVKMNLKVISVSSEIASYSNLKAPDLGCKWRLVMRYIRMLNGVACSRVCRGIIIIIVHG